MTTPPAPNLPALTPQAERDRQDRLDREAAALRANLRRRKDQQRARQPGPGPAPDTTKKENVVDVDLRTYSHPLTS